MMNIETRVSARQLNYGANTQNRKMTKTLEGQTVLNSAPDADITTDAALSDETAKSSGGWTDTAFYILDSSPRGYSVNTEALSKVRAQLKAEGIDADRRTPTHQITDEQREWLGAKYDLAYLGACSISEPEFGNFMLDLAYLNVFSLEEVENMYAGVFPPLTDEPQMISIYYHGDPQTGEGAGYVFWAGKDVNADVINEDMPLDHIFNYFKATSPGRTENEYLQMAKEYADQFQNRIKIFNDLFAEFSNKIKTAMGSAHLNIEDASDKFKEDYGSLVKSSDDDLLSAAPKRWLEEWTGESPVKKAVQFLKDMGIDAENREPTHSLTDEQKEWLRSRHDLDSIYNHTGTPLDEYNFRADLVYLGVLAPDEAEYIGVHVIPTHSNSEEMPLLLTKESSDNYLDGLRNILSRKKTLVDYFLEKYNDPRRRQDEDISYIEAERRLIDIHKTYLSMMEDLFG